MPRAVEPDFLLLGAMTLFKTIEIKVFERKNIAYRRSFSKPKECLRCANLGKLDTFHVAT